MRPLALLGLAAVALLSACDDSPSGPAPIARIEVSAPAPSVTAGQTLQLSATAIDASGNVLNDRGMTWSSDNQAVATVSVSGLVTGVAPGTATVSAGAEGQVGRITLTITPVPVASVAVFPLTATLTVGSNQTFVATAMDAAGNTLAGRTIAWTTADPSIATVDGVGLVTAIAPGGPVAITATVEGRSAVSQVTVIPVPIATLEISPNPAQVRAGETVQLTLVARDAAGNVLSGRAATLSSSDNAVATVDASAVVTGRSAGTAIITATAEGKTATATVNVAPGPVLSVEVTPQSPSVRVGATIQLSATLRDASGAVLTGRTVTWTSSDPTKATVSDTGLVTGVAEGTATITATSEGKSASTTVSVLRMPVASVRFAPFPDPFIVGDTARARAVAVDSTGREMPDRVVTFSGSNDAVATVSSSGLMSAFSAGSVTITATSEGVSATQTGSILEVRVSYSDLTCTGVTVGATCTSSARLRYVNAFGGNGVEGIPYTITFTSLDPGIATYEAPRTDRSATLRGVAPGTARVVARYTGVNGVTRVNEMTVQVNP